MSGDPLLSELCAICHLNWPKYKCPRCTAQTCSLPCVKRHKLWSQCTGVRDPAIYRKRRELATASSVDQDYNFITKVERAVESAHEKTEECGIAVDEDRGKRVKGQARRDDLMHQKAAMVLRAPPGMSRALQNKSHWNTKKQCFMWTFEWVFEDGTKMLDNCSESREIKDAYLSAASKHKGNKRQSSHSTRATPRTIVGAEAVIGDLEDATRPDELDRLPTTYFYLHRPNLPSDVRCVIPVQAGALLRDILQGRVLIEFPTVFVLSVPKERLQRPFVTEEHYLSQRTITSSGGSSRQGPQASADVESNRAKEA